MSTYEWVTSPGWTKAHCIVVRKEFRESRFSPALCGAGEYQGWHLAPQGAVKCKFCARKARKGAK